MSNVCTPCNTAKLIPACITDLTIGTIGSNNADVYIYIKNISTGRLLRFDATSNGAGLVIVDISSQEWMQNQAYELWITLATAVSIDDKENITISGDSFSCFEISFVQVKDEEGNVITYASQTLEIA